MPRSDDGRPGCDAVRLAELGRYVEGVRAVDLPAADARIVQQIGRAIDQVAGDAAAREGDLVVARVDRDGAAVDFPGDDEVGPDIDQARLPRPRSRQRRALQELGARGQRPVVRHRLAGPADAHVLPADEAVGADLDCYVIRAGAERSRHCLSLRRIGGLCRCRGLPGRQDGRDTVRLCGRLQDGRGSGHHDLSRDAGVAGWSAQATTGSGGKRPVRIRTALHPP